MSPAPPPRDGDLPALRSRIVGYGKKPPDQFLFHPDNPTIHPNEQREALRELFALIGVVAPVIESRGTGHVLDGHLRIDEAERMSPGEPIDYAIVDLTPDEETRVLQYMNEIGRGSARDDVMMRRLLAEVPPPPDSQLEAMVAGLLAEPLLPGLLAGDQSGEPEDGDDQAGEPPARPGVGSLAERFIIPPFNVLDARRGYWQARKAAWLALGIQSELGRGADLRGQSWEGRRGYQSALHDPGPVAQDKKADGATANARRGYNYNGGTLGAQDTYADPRYYEKKRAVEAALGHELDRETFQSAYYFGPSVSADEHVARHERGERPEAEPPASPRRRGAVFGNDLASEASDEAGPGGLVGRLQKGRLRQAFHNDGDRSDLARPKRGEAAREGLGINFPMRTDTHSVYGSTAREDTRQGEPGETGGLLIQWQSGNDPAFYWKKQQAEHEAGREMTVEEFARDWYDGPESYLSGTSIFDPVLCELAYRWFSPPAGFVLDPFAGGSVRGIVAAKLGRSYTGIELSAAQVEANMRQAADILGPSERGRVGYRVGAAQDLLDSGDPQEAAYPPAPCDLLFTCPPYFDLERYSDDPDDLSAMAWPDFCQTYRRIIARACDRLADDRFAVWVIGDVREQGGQGAYRDLVGETISAFAAAGLVLYNRAVLVTMLGSLAVRVGRQFSGYRKLGSTHQYMLVFLKGDARRAVAACGEIEVAFPEGMDAGLPVLDPDALAADPEPEPEPEPEPADGGTDDGPA